MLEFLQRLLQRPSSVPVSKALEVEDGFIQNQVRRAIAAVDRVHTDGKLPRLPIENAELTDMYGYFRNKSDGTAVKIVINTLNPTLS